MGCACLASCRRTPGFRFVELGDAAKAEVASVIAGIGDKACPIESRHGRFPKDTAVEL
jgi:hypothetical protein